MYRALALLPSANIFSHLNLSCRYSSTQPIHTDLPELAALPHETIIHQPLPLLYPLRTVTIGVILLWVSLRRRTEPVIPGHDNNQVRCGQCDIIVSHMRNKNAGRLHTLQTVYHEHPHLHYQKGNKLKELINRKLEQRMATLQDSPRKKLLPL